VGPAWIRYVSAGIALLIIGLGFVIGGLGKGKDIGILIFFVLCGVGAAMLIRGLLHRKYYLKDEISAENNSTKKEKSA
jgi:multisubunit Na+/H+ antiporter MnhG subunit